MNRDKLKALPEHITHVRQGHTIFERTEEGHWNPITFETVSAAKRAVRTEIGCKGGPKSNVRTAESLGL